jgi:hypothetical protein|tara:strand:+ start:289 stop:462 length:174 start_codon:yes stop_codon:yes gene_type:complete
MKTMTSLSIHEITEIEITTEVLDAVGKPFSVTKYRFIDDQGNVVTVNAFLKRRENDG